MGSFSFENQGMSTFLVYSAEEDISFDTLSLGMLTNNQIEGLIPVVYTELDSTKYLRYNITSKISLQQYFQGIIKKDQFVKVFYSIIKTMISVKEYMIPEQSVILDTDRIYVDVSDNSAAMICLPIMNKNAYVDISGFLKKIMFSITFDQNEDCRYVARVINYLNGAANLSLEEFEKILLEIARERPEEPAGEFETAAEINTPNTVPVNNNYRMENMQGYGRSTVGPVNSPAENTENVIPPQQRKPIMDTVVLSEDMKQNSPAQNSNINNTEIKKGRLWPFGKKEKEKGKAKPKKEKKSNQTVFMNQMKSQAPLSGPGDMKIPNREVKFEGGFGNPQKEGAAATQQPQRQFQQQPQAPMQSVQPIQQRQQSQQPIQPRQQPIQPQPQPPMQPPVQSIQQPQMTPAQQSQPGPVISVVKAGETVELSSINSQSGLKPVLVRMKTGERIQIPDNILRIGREQQYVDYCIEDNMAVGRCHANIFIRDNECYITDNNSKNHTYVDGRKLEPGQEYKLSNGMRIMLANEDFDFKFM